MSSLSKFVLLSGRKIFERGCHAASLWIALVLVACWGFAAMAAPPLRIATYGTSITENGDWQTELATSLGRCGGRAIEVVNFGKGGKGSKWGLENVDRVIAAKPDAVTIEFAINDADLKIGVAFDQFQRQTEELILRLSEGLPKAKLYLIVTNPTWGRQAGRRPDLYRYYDFYRTFAGRLGVSVVDTEKFWLKMAFRDIGDGLHPSRVALKAVLVPRLALAIKRELCNSPD